MKIVIPLAGYGTRLRPHTFTKPKPLINVAGRPVLGHVLNMFRGLDDVEEFIFITGHLGDQIQSYVAQDFPHITAHYYEQKEMNGQSTAVILAEERLRGPMLLVFVDTIVETDLSALQNETADAVAWVKPVEDPRRFGVAELGPDGYVARLIEKPSDATNNLAVVGFYYLKQAERLVQAIHEQLERKIQTKGEYFLADALQLLLEGGLRMRVQPVDVWLDCGKPETVLQTNQYLLEHGHGNVQDGRQDGYVVIPPVHIDPSARIVNSVIGPYATISADCHIENALIRDSIIDAESSIHDTMLSHSLIGRQARVAGRYRSFNVGDSSEVGFS